MRARNLLFCLSLLLPFETLLSAATPERPELIKQNVVVPTLLLAPPAENGSEENRAELDELVRLQSVRTKKDNERSKSEEKLGLKTFQSVYGDWFTEENLPKLATLMTLVDADSKLFVTKAKNHFDRKRPYNEDNRIQPSLEKEKSLSYPSGHATRGILFALILADMTPEHKKELNARGLEIGWDRVVSGLHYPSDVYAGRVLGLALSRAFLTSTDFQTRFAEAKAEFETVAQQHAAHATAGK
jgi:acid phosphatase (class A)